MQTKTVIGVATAVVLAAGVAVGYFLFPWRDYFPEQIDPEIFNPSVCGNGTLETLEQCDPTACTTGSDGVFCGSLTACEAGQVCDPDTCTCESYASANCGNGVFDPGWGGYGEECDPTACSQGTGGVFCGGTQVCDAGELCDSNSCACLPEIEVSCGNGALEPEYGEQCDPRYCTEGTFGVICGGVLTCGAGSLCDASSCQCVVGGPKPVDPSGPGRRFTEPIAVYDCRCTTPDSCQWYTANGEYVEMEDGTIGFVSAQITGGPFTGPWQGGCPDVGDGEQPPGGDEGPQEPAGRKETS